MTRSLAAHKDRTSIVITCIATKSGRTSKPTAGGSFSYRFRSIKGSLQLKNRERTCMITKSQLPEGHSCTGLNASRARCSWKTDRTWIIIVTKNWAAPQSQQPEGHSRTSLGTSRAHYSWKTDSTCRFRCIKGSSQLEKKYNRDRTCSNKKSGSISNPTTGGLFSYRFRRIKGWSQLKNRDRTCIVKKHWAACQSPVPEGRSRTGSDVSKACHS